MSSESKEMEVFTCLESTNNIKNRTLTPLRIIRGLLCLTVYISTAFMLLVYLVPILAVFLRFFTVHYSRKAVSYAFGLWLGLWPFLFEKINKTKVIFSGDIVPERERVLLIANHRTEVDWMYLWNLALRKGCLGHIKYILKNSLMKLPIFGWGFHVLEFIPVERKWEIDEPVLSKILSTFSHREDPLWLTVFPEGTDFNEKKCERSQKFASENGLPLLKNVLLPKIKGFHACLENLRASLDAVYDLTIAYKNRCPTFMDNVFGLEPSEVHINVRRILLEEIPRSEKETGKWLINTFQLKDQLLSDFIANGHFHGDDDDDHGGIGEEELSTMKCTANFAVVIAVTILFIYLTFYSNCIWFKIYAASSCTYLAFSSYFTTLGPLSSVDFVKEILCPGKAA